MYGPLPGREVHDIERCTQKSGNRQTNRQTFELQLLYRLFGENRVRGSKVTVHGRYGGVRKRYFEAQNVRMGRYRGDKLVIVSVLHKKVVTDGQTDRRSNCELRN